MNTLLLDALKCKNSARAPVWLMRQAGRYMPQYRTIRSKYSFTEMYRDPELAAEITLLPIKILGVDAAILFSDILVMAEALGVGLHFEDNKGPIIERPLNTLQDAAALPRPSIQQALGFVGEAIKILRSQLQVPLLGFCGAPFTLTSYLIEGGTSHDLKKTKQWMLQEPDSFHQLLGHITECTLDYLDLQIDAGAQALQIFDSWANVLAHSQFTEFCLPYYKKLKDRLEKRQIPSIFFCKGSSVFAPELAQLRPSAISIDWNADIGEIRRVVPSTIALQGNLDPDFLYAPKPLLQREIKKMLRTMRKDKGYIFNLGHGIRPDVSLDAVKTLVETVTNYG